MRFDLQYGYKPRKITSTIPPPLGSFFQEDDGVGFVIFLAESLLVARLQGRLCAGALREEEHSAVQAVHVELAVYVYAFEPDGLTTGNNRVARPDVFAEEVVARARLDFQEDLFAFHPREECGVVHCAISPVLQRPFSRQNIDLRQRHFLSCTSATFSGSSPSKARKGQNLFATENVKNYSNRSLTPSNNSLTSSNIER